LVRWAIFKRSVIGRPLASDELHDQLLPKTLALPVFASDPLSSVAYATEESMLVLALAGAAAFAYLTPVSVTIALLLLIVIISYRQTIRAYPDGGGAFIVALDNLGLQPAMVAAAALLTDYTLTVSVSVAAGVAAITSAFPVLSDWRVEIAVGLVILLTLANLRGVKESSTLFAIPTYAFVVTVFVMLVTGFVECIDGECPKAISAGTEVVPEVAAVSVFLILRAFASGSTALTGVEAIANGVPAFREPRAHNAATTLAVMGAISITMFLGISTLARLFDVRITEETVDEFGTVLSQIGRAAFNEGLGFWILQVVTAGILILAANTAYQDFPRLSAILARHKLMPRQFRNLGDRLVFSNGVIALAAIASLLIIVFDAEVTRLIQLYVIGVFISFTLSQAGMVRHWLRIRESGWRRSVVINAIGAVTTGVVLVVTATVKFSGGAWIVLVAIPLLVMLMASVRRHYLNVADQLRHVPAAPPFPGRNRAMVLVTRLGEATRRAVAYAEMIGAETVSAVHIREPRDEELVETWSHLFPGLPLTLVQPDRDRTYRTLRSLIRAERQSHPDAFTTVIVPELIRSRSIWAVLASPHALVVKLLLLFERGVVVTDLTQQRRPVDRTLVLAPTLERQEAVILISEVTPPARQAIGYSQLLSNTTVRAVHLDIDEEQRNRVLRKWDFDLGTLEVVESPYRGIVRPILRYLRRLRREVGPDALINVVIPEFIVPGWLAQFLHNQTAFAIKATLLFEPGVSVSSVPWHLLPANGERQTGDQRAGDSAGR
jgi:amino acid transporter